MAAATRLEHYSGPLPHPDMLAKYDALAPGSAATIIARMEKQSDHRMEMEKLVVVAEIRRSYAGLVAGLVVSLSVIGAGVYAIFRGNGAAGTAMIGTVLAGVVVAFVVGTVRRSKERVKKAEAQVQLVRGVAQG